MFKLKDIASGVKRVIGRAKQALVPHTVAEDPKPNLFLGQHTNPRKNAERRLKARIGARQFRKQKLAFRRAQREVRAS